MGFLLGLVGNLEYRSDILENLIGAATTMPTRNCSHSPYLESQRPRFMGDYGLLRAPMMLGFVGVSKNSQATIKAPNKMS